MPCMNGPDGDRSPSARWRKVAFSARSLGSVAEISSTGTLWQTTTARASGLSTTMDRTARAICRRGSCAAMMTSTSGVLMR